MTFILPEMPDQLRKAVERASKVIIERERLEALEITSTAALPAARERLTLAKSVIEALEVARALGDEKPSAQLKAKTDAVTAAEAEVQRLQRILDGIGGKFAEADKELEEAAPDFLTAWSEFQKAVMAIFSAQFMSKVGELAELLSIGHMMRPTIRHGGLGWLLDEINIPHPNKSAQSLISGFRHYDGPQMPMPIDLRAEWQGRPEVAPISKVLQQMHALMLPLEKHQRRIADTRHRTRIEAHARHMKEHPRPTNGGAARAETPEAQREEPPQRFIPNSWTSNL